MRPRRLLREAAGRLDVELQRAQRRAFEVRFGVETRGRAYLEDRNLGDEERVCYQSCDWISTRRAIRAVDPGPEDVFADLGCGKGPAVVIAARLPFRRVAGVEIAPDLAAIARRNVARARKHLRCPDVTIATADMLDWPIPDDLSVAYLYCPVVGDTFSRLAARLIASFDANPRRLRIVYNYPWEHNLLLGTGRVRVTDVARGHWPARPRWWARSEVIVTYELVAEGAPLQPVAPPGGRRSAAFERWSGPNDTIFRLYRKGRPPIVSR